MLLSLFADSIVSYIEKSKAVHKQNIKINKWI